MWQKRCLVVAPVLAFVMMTTAAQLWRQLEQSDLPTPTATPITLIVMRVCAQAPSNGRVHPGDYGRNSAQYTGPIFRPGRVQLQRDQHLPEHLCSPQPGSLTTRSSPATGWASTPPVRSRDARASPRLPERCKPASADWSRPIAIAVQPMSAVATFMRIQRRGAGKISTGLSTMRRRRFDTTGAGR